MKIIRFSLFLVATLLINVPMDAAQNAQSIPQQAMNSLKNRYRQVTACLKGEKPCSPVDFALLAVATVAMYKITLRLYKMYRQRPTRGASYMYLQQTGGTLQ